MSMTLLAQSVVDGIMAGSLYALLALSLSLSWGLLRLVNISYFGLAFLGAYLTYHLGTVFHLEPWWSALIILPAFFVYGVALHAVFVRFGVAEMASMLVTFGISVLIESLIQWYWTADFRKYDIGYSDASFRVGVVYVPELGLIACLAAIVLAVATWGGLNRTRLGKALRASAQDGPIAAAFGIDSRKLAYILAGTCAVYAGIAGIFIALTSTLAPSQIDVWIGVVFAVVIIGGLANPLGALAAGMLIGVTESLTMAAVNPAWAPLVAFSVLIGLLLWNPKWA